VAPAPKALDGLPIVEVPAAQRGDTLAIFLSGDGGWAGLDKEVAAHLADHGVAVVGLDSLRYFWSARTPSGVADDLVRIADHYRQRWQRPRLLLIGFSQGADVLPASINQMTPAMRSRIALVALMSLGRRAEFEFHVSNWLGSSDQGLPIAPEVARLPQDRTLCLYGLKDADALCPGLPPGGIRVLPLPGDHHFDGDHERLAREILAAASAGRP
jgi:type IV secretory pathway VirJ component